MTIQSHLWYAYREFVTYTEAENIAYDRALARVPAGIPVAALLYDGEVVAHLPRDPWDRPVNAYVTPSAGWIDI